MQKELGQVTRDHAKLVDAIVANVPTAQVTDKMISLDARRQQIEALLATAEASLAPVCFHPKISETYRDRVATLICGLGDGMEEAREALRGLT